MGALPSKAQAAFLHVKRTLESWARLGWFNWATWGVVILVLVWACQRGFDFTDEGYYYLNAKFPKEYSTIFTQFGVAAHALFHLANEKIWIMRLLVVAIHLLAGWVLWLGGSAWLGTRQLTWLPVIMLGSLAGFAWLPIALSYNSLNGLAATAWGGIWLWHRAKKAWWKLALLLLLSALAFAGKPTTGLCLLLCSVLAMLPRRIGKVLLLVGVAVLMLVAAMGLAIHWSGNAEAFATRIQITKPASGQLWDYLASKQELSLVALMGKAIITLWNRMVPLLIPVGLVALGWRTAARWDNDDVRMARWAGAFVAVVGACAYISVWQADGNIFGFMFFGAGQISVLLLITVIATLILPKSKTSAPDSWPELLLLALIPFFGWLGTHNPIELNSLFQIAPWLLVIFLCTDRVKAFPVGLLSSVLGLFVAVMLWLGVVEHPYRVAKPLYDLNKPTKLDESENILLMDGRSSSLINQTKSLLKGAGFKRNDPVLTLYHLPGLTYAIGARSPGLPWYSNMQGIHQGTGIDIAQRNTQALLEMPLGELKRSFILQTPGATAFIETLGQRGIRFPEDYTLLGKVPLPGQMTEGELSIWKPRMPEAKVP